MTSGRQGHRWSAIAVLIGLVAALPAATRAAPVVDFPLSPGSHSEGITAGPDGNLWFTEGNGDRIGRITPGGVVTEFGAGISPGARPLGIAAGPDGNLWFAEFGRGGIGRITRGGAVIQFSFGISGSPFDITAGPDGNLWFTEFDNGTSLIGRITPGGVVTEFPTGIGPQSLLHDIVAGPDGNLWFTENLGNRIGRITPAGVVTEFPSFPSMIGPAGSLLGDIAVGPDGNLWFTERGDRIGRITLSGAISEFEAAISPGSSPFDLTAGPDGNLWFTESFSDRIGRVSPAGVVTEFPSPPDVIRPGGAPEGIAAGPDGNLWFTEFLGDRIGRIATEAPAPTSGNLLRNPGFETGPRPLVADSATAPVPGWVAIPNFSAVAYGAPGGFPSAALGAQVGGGSAFAWGGPASAQSEAIQQVDVSAQSEAIDAGRASVTLSGLLGGFATQEDNARVSASYLGADGAALGGLQIGPVSAAERAGQTALLPRASAGPLPAGTRAVRVVALATRVAGPGNDGYFDNLALTLDVAPAPALAPALVPALAGGASAGAQAPRPTRPVLDRLAARPAAFSVASARRPGQTEQTRRRRGGTTISYRLSAPATVALTFARQLPGRRLKGRCRAASATHGRGQTCIYLRAAGGLRRAERAGADSFQFSGRLGGAPLAPGRYRLVARARDATGRTSAPRAIHITVLNPAAA